MSLSLEAQGFLRAVPAATGRSSYDPRDLLKLYIYGYLNRIRSSRRLMTECRRNVELFFFLNMLQPDFRTISDFRKDNCRALKEVFKDFVQVCAELNLLGKKSFAVDGTKIRASNSKKKAFTSEILDKKLTYLREQEGKIEEYLSHMDQEDREEQEHTRILELDVRPKDMPKELQQIRERIVKYEGYQKQMEETGKDQILETDPECRTIHTKEGFLPAYNIQAFYVPVYMYGNPKIPLQKIPDVEQHSPYNHFGLRKQADARVKLTIRRNPDDMQKRKELVEHPFGTVKWYDGAHYFLCRGKEKVTAEIALSFLTYNLRRAINLLGAGALVAFFNERKRKIRG